MTAFGGMKFTTKWLRILLNPLAGSRTRTGNSFEKGTFKTEDGTDGGTINTLLDEYMTSSSNCSSTQVQT